MMFQQVLDKHLVDVAEHLDDILLAKRDCDLSNSDFHSYLRIRPRQNQTIACNPREMRQPRFQSTMFRLHPSIHLHPYRCNQYGQLMSYLRSQYTHQVLYLRDCLQIRRCLNPSIVWGLLQTHHLHQPSHLRPCQDMHFSLRASNYLHYLGNHRMYQPIRHHPCRDNL